MNERTDPAGPTEPGVITASPAEAQLERELQTAKANELRAWRTLDERTRAIVEALGEPLEGLEGAVDAARKARARIDRQDELLAARDRAAAVGLAEIDRIAVALVRGEGMPSDNAEDYRPRSDTRRGELAGLGSHAQEIARRAGARIGMQTRLLRSVLEALRLVQPESREERRSRDAEVGAAPDSLWCAALIAAGLSPDAMCAVTRNVLERRGGSSGRGDQAGERGSAGEPRSREAGLTDSGGGA